MTNRVKVCMKEVGRDLMGGQKRGEKNQDTVNGTHGIDIPYDKSSQLHSDRSFPCSCSSSLQPMSGSRLTHPNFRAPPIHPLTWTRGHLSPVPVPTDPVRNIFRSWWDRLEIESVKSDFLIFKFLCTKRTEVHKSLGMLMPTNLLTFHKDPHLCPSITFCVSDYDRLSCDTTLSTRYGHSWTLYRSPMTQSCQDLRSLSLVTGKLGLSELRLWHTKIHCLLRSCTDVTLGSFRHESFPGDPHPIPPVVSGEWTSRHRSQVRLLNTLILLDEQYLRDSVIDLDRESRVLFPFVKKFTVNDSAIVSLLVCTEGRRERVHVLWG